MERATDTGHLSGRVTLDGSPVREANVSLVGHDTEPQVTDGDGKFSFTLEAGSYRLAVDGIANNCKVDISSGDQTEITLRVEEGVCNSSSSLLSESSSSERLASGAAKRSENFIYKRGSVLEYDITLEEGTYWLDYPVILEGLVGDLFEHYDWTGVIYGWNVGDEQWTQLYSDYFDNFANNWDIIVAVVGEGQSPTLTITITL